MRSQIENRKSKLLTLSFAQVEVPQQSSSDRPIWLPSFGNGEKFVRRRTLLAGEIVPRGVESDVALRHNIRPQHRHQQIDIGRPFADTFESDELFFNLRVV